MSSTASKVFANMQGKKLDSYWKKQIVLQHARVFAHKTSRNRYRLAVRAVRQAMLMETKKRKTDREELSKQRLQNLTAALSEHNMKRDVFMSGLKKADVRLENKMLIYMSLYEPRTLESLIELSKRTLIEKAWENSIPIPDRCFSKVLEH